MNVIGIVGEYNPFHLGHLDHFKKSRKILGEDAPIVCVMSGDFVQRGGLAVFNKFSRAEAAAVCGADIVFELPLPWCVMSAEGFARGAVQLLGSLGVVTHLSFGSEVGSLAPLTAVALSALEPETIERVKAEMENGLPFAAARQKVITKKLGDEAKLLETPNNILAVEYIKSIIQQQLDIAPVTTVREGAPHDKANTGKIRSAMELRTMLEAGTDVMPYVPKQTRKLLQEEMEMGRGPVTMADMESALMSRLRLLTEKDFNALPDASEGLGNRFFKAVRREGSVEEILSAVKTKRYPMSRLRRMILCAALGIRADMGVDAPPYARVLATTPMGRELLKTISQTAKIPVVVKPASVRELDENCRRVFALTADARDFYVLGYDAFEERRGGSDWRATPVTLE
jgi:predicted nucleotidyltransferase